MEPYTEEVPKLALHELVEILDADELHWCLALHGLIHPHWNHVTFSAPANRREKAENKT